MHDLNRVLAALRKENSPLSTAVRRLTDSLCRAMERMEQEPLLCLWRREMEFFGGAGSASFPVAGSVQTVYSILVKLIGWGLVGGGEKAPLEDILTGQAFRRRGVPNYCGADWYTWVLRCGDREVEEGIGALCAALDREDILPSAEEFRACYRGDSLKRIYETLISEDLRVALGEYYTPDWLAACIIENAVRAEGRTVGELRFIDPTCGAGTFLACVIRRIRSEGAEPGEEQLAGFDINPLAVLTARTNYLAALVGHREKFPDLIPIYRCDVLNMPVVRGDHLAVTLDCGVTCFLSVPVCEDMVRRRAFTPECLLREENGELTAQLAGYDEPTKQIIACALLERIFAFFEKKADIAVGNPPWVNWENLSAEYRERSRHLWAEYGLYNGRGKNVRFLKEDISVLMTCVVMERFLADGGLLSFALRQAVFKSEKNGAMFRRFSLEPSGTPFRVVKVDDLGKIKPFAGVNLRSALVLMRKNEEHTFPVPYDCWEKKRGFLKATRTGDPSAEFIQSYVEKTRTLAFPADRGEKTALWVNSPAEAVSVVEKMLGSNSYRARTGVFTGGANAVYWMDILGRENGLLRVTNLTGRAHRKTQAVVRDIEDTYLYPLVQGHDISLWSVSEGAYILCPHTAESKMRPVEEETLRRGTPGTYDYLAGFRAQLDARRGFAGWEKEIQRERFYAVLRLGDYAFGRYKVAWRYIAQSFITAVIEEREDRYLGRKLPLPNEKVMYVSLDDREEAYYLCGVLSSLPVSYAVRCYMNPTSISTHVLEKLFIPPYDPSDARHRRISALCEAGHRTADSGERDRLRCELDQAAAELYGLDISELAVIRRSGTCLP